MMTEYQRLSRDEQCIRCGRWVSGDSDDFIRGEVIGVDPEIEPFVDYEGNVIQQFVGHICSRCVTDAELLERVEADMCDYAEYELLATDPDEGGAP